MGVIYTDRQHTAVIVRTEISHVLQEWFRTIVSATACLRHTMRVTCLEAPVMCSSISRHTQGKDSSFVDDGLVIAIICRRALFARRGVGEGRNQTGLGQPHL